MGALVHPQSPRRSGRGLTKETTPGAKARGRQGETCRDKHTPQALYPQNPQASVLPTLPTPDRYRGPRGTPWAPRLAHWFLGADVVSARTALSPLRDARREQVARLLGGHRHGMVLNEETYRAARDYEGLTRAQLDLAIDDLVAADRAELVSEDGGPLVAQLVKEAGE